ncbi:hypothetical protein HIO71_03060 [Chryseobacterium aquaticum]|uniref:Uncharacterized protein n=1 Tax=Chryseobacterium aquaticum TaxID=452084 RepID=A0A848N0V7_9FLAO|nr:MULTISPECIES: hypothetical protein [Chryseobacterium]NMR33184.1 hypothetical protein [Chryseobacterium aquaticum]NRQ44884.1 hypothetical protein [Chryseobacterium sp. C-204]
MNTILGIKVIIFKNIKVVGMISKIIIQCKRTPIMIFVVDAIGALLSFLFLFMVAKKFSFYFGISEAVWVKLSLIALLMAFYSSLCSLGIKHRWILFLISISVINIAYCALTIGILIYYWSELKALGITYLSAEIVVILLLAFFELSSAKEISLKNANK